TEFIYYFCDITVCVRSNRKNRVSSEAYYPTIKPLQKLPTFVSHMHEACVRHIEESAFSLYSVDVNLDTSLK
ncbi:hypothetical protein, partial [uncultured Bacteroides sp.]|uniref:hypothetical protein n=1 Tax=uncultured Bacteroides sp. TaxID=162156 RepID=UPI0025B0D618